MHTATGPCPSLTRCIDHDDGAATAQRVGWLGFLMCCGLLIGMDSASAQDVAALPAASGESMNSLLGRIAPAAVAATSARLAPAPRVTFERSQLGDSERQSLGQHGLDVYGRPLVELGGVTYRWWVQRGHANFGLGVGTVGHIVASPDAGGGESFSPGSSVLTLGWRYQVNERSTLFADASGQRALNETGADSYSTKVGVEWKGRSSRFGLDGAARSLAVRLDSGYRMSVKVRRNGVGVYVKGQF